MAKREKLTPPVDIDDGDDPSKVVPAVSVADLCGGHEKQREAIETMLDPSTGRFQAWYCSRRAAKTTAIAIHDLKVAIDEPGSNQIYTALTRTQTREAMWRVTWLPLLAKALGPDDGKHGYKNNATNQQTLFENGSSVAFGGLDDIRHIQTFLGQNLRSFCSDESQGATSALLKALVEDVISPALSDNENGKFLLAGMLPDVPAGFYYEALTGGQWLVRNWNRFDNPHLKADQQQALAEYLRVTKLPLEHPEVQRRWFGRLVFDPGDTAFRYRDSRWRPTYAAWPLGISFDPGTMLASIPPPTVDTFSVGISPGTRKRWAVVLWGWSSKRRDRCYQIAEWTTPPDAIKADGTRVDWNDVAAVVDALYGRYRPIVRLYREPGSSPETLDLFGRYIGRRVDKTVKESDLGAQVERFASLLATGRLVVIEGSQLEADLRIAKWDTKARGEGRFEWSDLAGYPEVANAAVYGLQGFRELPPDPPGVELRGDAWLAWREEKAWRERDWEHEALASEKRRGDPFDRGF